MNPPRIFFEQYLERYGECPRVKKARELNKLGLIDEKKDGLTWEIRPIPGYNATTYRVSYDQATQSYFCNGKMCIKNNHKGMICAHILAVNLYLRLKRDHEIERHGNFQAIATLPYEQRFSF